MSYRGKPSKGCGMCRARKHKCDQQKPICSRCQKFGDECVYRDKFELVHRNQTSIVENRVRKQWGVRLNKKQDTSFAFRPVRGGKLAPKEPKATQLRLTSNVGIYIQPQISFHDLSLPRFMFDFTTSNSTSSRNTSLEVLPRMYTSSASDSFLRSAMNAAALSNFARRFKNSDASRSAATYYITALQQLAIAAGHLETMQSSEALLSVFLLGLYELFNCRDLKRPWITHIRGSESVLRSCGSLPSGSITGGNFRAFLVKILIIHYLADGISPPPEAKLWLRTFPPESPRRSLIQLMLEVANLCPQLRKIGKQKLEDFDADSVDASALGIYAASLDRRLLEWYRGLPPSWTCTREAIDLENRPGWQLTLLKHQGAPKVMHNYTDALIALDVNMSRATRLQLNLTMLESLPPAAIPVNDTNAIVSRIVDNIENMCSTIPVTLQISPSGKADCQTAHDIQGRRGHHLLFPLMVCRRCFKREDVVDQDTNGKRYWIEAVASFVNQELGYANVPLKWAGSNP